MHTDISVGFLEAAFFAEFGDGEIDALPPSKITFPIPDADIERIESFCAAFEARAATLLEEAFERGYTERQAGRDLYFTLARSGVGFWDREELQEGGLGERLTEAAGHGGVHLWEEPDEGTGEMRYGIYVY